MSPAPLDRLRTLLQASTCRRSPRNHHLLAMSEPDIWLLHPWKPVARNNQVGGGQVAVAEQERLNGGSESLEEALSSLKIGNASNMCREAERTIVAEMAASDFSERSTRSEVADYDAALEFTAATLVSCIAEPRYPSTSEAPEGPSRANTLLDIVTSVTPFVGFAKDLAILCTGLNPVTRETVGGLEYGLTVACILVPGALKGAVFGAVKAQRLFIATSGSAARVSAHCGTLAAAGQSIKQLTANATPRAATVSAQQLRSSRGIASASSKLFDGKTLLRGRPGVAGLVPTDIASRLKGRSFATFDEFRSHFWRVTAESKYATEFGEKNLALMRRGLAPLSPETQHFAAQKAYQLHHITPISRGGSVYDMSNIMIVTPRFHSEVLIGRYHYGGG